MSCYFHRTCRENASDLSLISIPSLLTLLSFGILEPLACLPAIAAHQLEVDIAKLKEIAVISLLKVNKGQRLEFSTVVCSVMVALLLKYRHCSSRNLQHCNCFASQYSSKLFILQDASRATGKTFLNKKNHASLEQQGERMGAFAIL